MYLRELCCSTVTIQRRISLRFSTQSELRVPRTRTVIRQRQASSLTGPTAWSGVLVALRLTPVTHFALFLSSPNPRITRFFASTEFQWGQKRPQCKLVLFLLQFSN